MRPDPGSEISFYIRGTPKSWKRPDRNRKTGAVFTQAQDRAWRDSVWGQAMPHKPDQPWAGPVSITLVFRLPIPKSWPQWRRAMAEFRWAPRRPDLDNLAKAVLDALTGTFFVDDAQVCQLHLERRYSPSPLAPGVAVSMDLHEGMPERKPKQFEKEGSDGNAS